MAQVISILLEILLIYYSFKLFLFLFNFNIGPKPIILDDTIEHRLKEATKQLIKKDIKLSNISKELKIRAKKRVIF
jgi:hypothetical protein